MLARVITHALVGLEARPVEVEAHLQRGVPAFLDRRLAGQGLPGGQGARPERDTERRARVAAPADHGQSRSRGPAQGGSGFDLPIALAVLAASRQVPPEAPRRARRSWRARARRAGPARAGRARRRRGRAAGGRSTGSSVPPSRRRRLPWRASSRFPCVIWLRRSATSAARSTAARRAVRGATSGGPARPRVMCAGRSARAGHSSSPQRVATISSSPGPPGTGKTMLARRLPGILPSLTIDEALEVTRIHSVAGLLPPGGARRRAALPRPAPHRFDGRHRRRGCRAPARRGEPRASRCAPPGRAGGVRPARDRVAPTAARGRTSPMARVTGRIVFPARFVLVGTMNLCPCGARGDPASSAGARRNGSSAYRDKLSRALLDRFDLVVHLPRARSRSSSRTRRVVGGRASRVESAAAVGRGAARLSNLLPISSSRERSTRCRSPRGAGHGSAGWRGPSPRSPETSSVPGAPRRGALLQLSHGARGRGVTAVSLNREQRSIRALLRGAHTIHPPVFTCEGAVELLGSPSVAVVGARSCSAYGAQVARMLGRELAAAESGGRQWARPRHRRRGASRSARSRRGHGGRPRVRGRPRLSRASCGARCPHRGERRDRLRVPPGVEPAPWRFPARNRIIAGLTLATVVVEARARSGALITADFALELRREVFAVPGEITCALSAGTNDLLRQGAFLCSPHVTFSTCSASSWRPGHLPASQSPGGWRSLRLLADGAAADELPAEGRALERGGSGRARGARAGRVGRASGRRLPGVGTL